MKSTKKNKPLRGALATIVYEAIIEDASGLGGSMGTESTSLVDHRLFRRVTEACAWFGKHPEVRQHIRGVPLNKSRCFSKDIGSHILRVHARRLY